MKKPATAEQFTRLISEIETACKGTAWEVMVYPGWEEDSFRIAIRLTAETRRQQFENQGDDVYAPEIYFDEDCRDAQPWSFRIQTTSFGTLSASEIERLAAAYLKASELAHQLTGIIKAHCEA